MKQPLNVDATFELYTFWYFPWTCMNTEKKFYLHAMMGPLLPLSKIVQNHQSKTIVHFLGLHCPICNFSWILYSTCFRPFLQWRRWDCPRTRLQTSTTIERHGSWWVVWQKALAWMPSIRQSHRMDSLMWLLLGWSEWQRSKSKEWMNQNPTKSFSLFFNNFFEWREITTCFWRQENAMMKRTYRVPIHERENKNPEGITMMAWSSEWTIEISNTRKNAQISNLLNPQASQEHFIIEARQCLHKKLPLQHCNESTQRKVAYWFHWIGSNGC